MKIIENILGRIEDLLLDSIDITLNLIEEKLYKLRSGQEVLDAIREEALKLGLNYEKIHWVGNPLIPNRDGWYDILAGSFKFDKFKFIDEYGIILNGFGSRNRTTIRHELYHIYRGDCDRPAGFRKEHPLRYLFVAEPRAMIYEYFGLRL